MRRLYEPGDDCRVAESGHPGGLGGPVEGGGCGGIGVRREVCGEVGSPAGDRVGSSFIHLIRTDSNAFFLTAE